MSKFFKKLLIVFSLIGLLFVNNFSYVFAETSVQKQVNDNSTPDAEIAQSIKIYQTIGQTLYAFTWPVLVIADTFLDNRVVYGSFLGMDVQLWKLWNVMRTFANYVIGFLLIFSIFTLFLGGKFEKFNPIKLLPQLVVSAILVNASWFLLGVCIDLSNVLTYAVGGLPLKILKDNNGSNNGFDKIKFTKIGIKFQSNKNNPMVIGILDGSEILPFCSFSYDAKERKFVPYIDNDSKADHKKGECVYLCGKKYYKLSVQQKIDSLLPKNGKCEGTAITPVSQDVSKLMLHPLSTIYAGMLNVGELATFNSGGKGIMFTETVLKLLFLLALLIPLLVLAIILIVRVVLIWAYIILSPFIFLFTPLKDIGGNLLGKKWELKNVCCVIFLPTFVLFALSISIVFLYAISFFNGNKDMNNIDKGFLSYLGINKCTSADKKSGCVEIQPITNGDTNWKIKIHSHITSESSSTMITDLTDLDKLFTLIIKRIFGIGFMWITVFTALKSCEATEKIAYSVQKFAESMVESTPIIPVPGAGRQSIGSLMKGAQFIERMPQSKQQEDFDKKIRPFLDELERSISGIEKKNVNNANSKAADLTKVSFTPKTVVQNISSDKEHKKLLNEEISNLLKDKTSLQYVASQVGISEDELRKMMDNNNAKEMTLEKFLENYKENITEKIQKQSIKKFIDDAVLGKQITLLQLSDTAKDYVKQILLKVTGINIPEISANENLAQALLELGFSEEQVMKLLASNLEGGKIPADEEKKLKELLEKIKKTKKS